MLRDVIAKIIDDNISTDWDGDVVNSYEVADLIVEKLEIARREAEKSEQPKEQD